MLKRLLQVEVAILNTLSPWLELQGRHKWPREHTWYLLHERANYGKATQVARDEQPWNEKCFKKNEHHFESSVTKKLG